MADTKWADVAHYYLGSSVRATHMGQVVYMAEAREGSVFWQFVGSWNADFPIEDIDGLPILRHLEDITGEEAMDYYTIKTGLPSKYVNRIIIRGKSADIVSVTYLKKFPAAKVIFVDIANKATPLGGQHTTKEFIWLISRGFDMFKLIESGQAIRKEAGNG